MAHAEPDAQQQHIDTIRSLSEEFNEPIAILIDLSGPKIRLGDIAGDQIFCNLGQEFFLIDGDQPQLPNELTSTYPPLVDELQPGNRVMLADGTVCMEVVAKSARRIQLRVIQRGAHPQSPGYQPTGRNAQRAGDQRPRSRPRYLGRRCGCRFRGPQFRPLA